MAINDRHPNCIHPLCGCAGTANCKSDPMNMPLPCDVKVGSTTFRKGVKLGTFVMAAQHWHREAFPDTYNLTDVEQAANLARLQGRTSIGDTPAPQSTDGGEPARPDILERLSYHQLERDDLTLDECLSFLAKGWAKVHGRTERQMVMQIMELLASAPCGVKGKQ